VLFKWYLLFKFFNRYDEEEGGGILL